VERRYSVVGRRSSRSTTTAELRAETNLGWLTMRVSMIADEFEVHEPEELRERLRRWPTSFAAG
jgi:hypothetical protein